MPERTPKRTTAKGSRARTRIVAEATRIFAHDGYRSGSLAAIARAAGLTQQGLLHYFPTKADLLLAVVEEREERTAAAVGDRDGPRALDAFVEGVRHNATEPHLVELMTVLSAESISADHPTHDWFVGRYEELVAHLAEAVATEQESGDSNSSLDPQFAARIMVALADGLRLQKMLGKPALDHADALATVLRWLRSGTVTGSPDDETH